MNYKEFKEYIENMVPYETIYEDGEGRMIMVIKMLDAYAMMNRKWVGLTDEERLACTESPFTDENYRAIEAKLKEKNQ